jgi:hypothetical protein
MARLRGRGRDRAELHLLAGGSSQEAWSLDVVCDVCRDPAKG